MGFFRRRSVKYLGDDRFAIMFGPELRQLVASLASELSDMLDDDSDDLRRLFPTAYSDDPERDAGYQILARGELIDQRRESIQTVQATVADEELNEEQLTSWMAVVNDLRLVLGTRLDVSEDDDLQNLAEDDPDFHPQYLYQILGIVLSDIVDGLAETLPD